MQTFNSRPKNPPRNRFAIEVHRAGRNAEAVGHHRLEGELRSGALELAIETLAPLHVGSGGFGLFRDELVKEVMRRGGRPVVPGSSIKGTCRQTYEVLTDSTSPFDRGESFNRRRRSLLSPAGALFGALGYEGRVSFSDAALPEGAEPVKIRLSVAYPPRRKTGRRFYGRLPPGAEQPRRIPALAIPAGVSLTTSLRFRNLDPAELGGVLTSLGVSRFTPRLGGGKYDDFGWVRFRLRRYRLREGFGDSHWEEDPAAVEALCDRCLTAFEPTADGRKALETLSQRLQAPGQAGGGRA